MDDICAQYHIEHTFTPNKNEEKRTRRLKGWKKAVKAAIILTEDN
jgi:glycerol kinase